MQYVWCPPRGMVRTFLNWIDKKLKERVELRLVGLDERISQWTMETVLIRIYKKAEVTANGEGVIRHLFFLVREPQLLLPSPSILASYFTSSPSFSCTHFNHEVNSIFFLTALCKATLLSLMLSWMLALLIIFAYCLVWLYPSYLIFWPLGQRFVWVFLGSHLIFVWMNLIVAARRNIWFHWFSSLKK